MAEYIDRDALLARLDGIWDCCDITFPDGRDHICKPEDCKGCKWRDVLAAFKKMVKNAPAADVAPVVHAHWIPKQQIVRSPYVRNYVCSNCAHEPLEAIEHCPNCGAKMDGEATP